MMVKSRKQQQIEDRSIKHGLLFIKRNATIRSVAEETGSSKSMVHLDLHRLEKIHKALYEKVMEKLDYNFSVKHLRGGHTTKMKSERKKKNDSK